MSEIKERRSKRRSYNKKEIIEEEIEIIDDEPINKKTKNKLKKGEKIFIILNILVILLIIAYYAYRTVYYYKREHDNNKDITLKEKITRLENITYQNDGLYVNDDYYYFRGVDVDNYLYYSGRMFRIISISDGIKMIEDNSVVNLVYGINSSYNESLIKKWLNNYFDTYKDADVYLMKNDWCNELVDVNNYKCKNNLNEYIGLINTKEYLDAGGVNSYLNNGSYYWTINYDSDNNGYFINKDGGINNIVSNNDNYHSYGVRPVITLSGDVLYQSGDGTITNPYILEGEAALLKDNSIGSYVKYNKELYRIINIDDDGVSLLLENELDVEKKYNEVSNYLNKEYIKKYNKDDLVKQKSITNIYNFDNKYNYLEEEDTIDEYIIVPKIGDMFVNNQNNFWLSSISDKKLKTYYIIDDNNMYFGDLNSNVHKIRPIIKLKSDKIVKEGNGMKDNPLVVGEA